METARQTILDHAIRLAVSNGEVPSLNTLASEAGVSKGGLTHHFPTRDALLAAIAEDAIAAIDLALSQASGGPETLRTWLKLSIPDKKDVALFQSMAALFFTGKSSTASILNLAADANKRWEVRLQKELGSVRAARTAMLLGDGLMLGAISGTITDKNSATYLRTAEDAVTTFIEAGR